MRKIISFVLFLTVSLVQFVSVTAFSQAVTEETLNNRFKSYAARGFQEKLFLHTDKEFYVAGEIVWFRIYYTDAASHVPMGISKIAYAEILNEKNEPVVQARISLQNADGSFYLPTSLATGYYTIRAYTNWMKNFEQHYFFEKRIAVVNTIRSEMQAVKIDSSATINFFPEGGNLVAGIDNRLAFSVTNQNGSLNNCSGYIVDETGDTLTFFSPLKFGLGSFNFNPASGKTYKAIVTLPGGKTVNGSLPEIYSSGYVMKVKENGQGQLAITLYRKRLPGENNSQQLTLAAHSRQTLHAAERVQLNDNDSTTIVIPKEKLAKGVNHFTVFTENGKPVCERLYFIKPQRSIDLDLKTDQPSYKNRQKINLSIQALFNKTANDALDLSVSVFHTDSLQQPGETTIYEYMWLLSDLGGDVESPVYYFSEEADVPAATDNLMLTHGWRKFRWDDILKGDEAFIKYLPEVNGHLVSGRVIDSRNGQPAKDITAYLSIAGKPFGFYTSKSDANGWVNFEVKNYYGNSQVFIQPGIGMDSFYRVDITKPFVPKTSLPGYSSYSLTSDLAGQLLRKSIGMQVQNIYAGDSLRNFSDPLILDTFPFFGRAEASYKLDEYKRFTTMEEVLREYVREIGVGARNDKLIFRIFNPLAHDFYAGNELLLLDGVPITDVDKIFFYDPLKVKIIDVIRSRYVVGNSTFNGLASFTTYEGRFDGFELNPSLVSIDYSGLQLQRQFFSPVYETAEQLQKRVPDFRNTLYWSPAVSTNKEGKTNLEFYSSDLPGRYTVVVQGISEKGELVSGQVAFEVK